MESHAVITITLLGIVSALIALLKLVLGVKAKTHVIEENTNGVQMAQNNLIKELRETNVTLREAAAAAMAEKKALLLAQQFGELSARVAALEVELERLKAK